MVKDPITRPRRPDPLPKKRDRKAPTRAKGGGEEIREARLVMRVHQDLIDLVDIRSRERGESRSRYIERLLVAFLAADPRNPKLDPWGRIQTDGPPISKVGDPLRFGAAWSRFAALNENLLGTKIPDAWLDEDPGFVDERRTGRAYQADQDD